MILVLSRTLVIALVVCFAIRFVAYILALVGILLSPTVGALLMSLSTVIVVTDVQPLRHVDLSLPNLPGVTSPVNAQTAD